MPNDYRMALQIINAWSELPHPVRFVGEGGESPPALILEPQKGGTGSSGGRRFRLIYRIFPDPEGEFLYAADFFDQLDTYFTQISLNFPTGDSDHPLAWIRRRSGLVLDHRNQDGSHDYAAEYSLFTGIAPTADGGESGESGDSTADEALPPGLTVRLGDLPLTGGENPALTGITGLISPLYATESRPRAFGEGSVVTAHTPTGRRITLKLALTTPAAWQKLAACQGDGPLDVTLALADGQTYRGDFYWESWSETGADAGRLTLFSPQPCWLNPALALALGESSTLVLTGHDLPLWQLELTVGDDLVAPRVAINGRSLVLADRLPAGTSWLAREGILWQLTDAGRVRSADFALTDWPATCLGENSLSFTADAGSLTAGGLMVSQRFRGI